MERKSSLKTTLYPKAPLSTCLLRSPFRFSPGEVIELLIAQIGVS
jgi:hypothetical protein